jgi:hypothetical protein
MSDATSFRAIIELWPSKEAMASDVGAGPWAVSKWWQRNSIPAEWWSAVLGAEPAREAGVTAEMLTALAARDTASIGEPAEVRP